ncbi:alpha/beta hydrolase [Paenibacillus campi]|uniref:alpha/beta fold hydrolase n=1 Tax=Paenibacillus campi TaxID=3106031 RepID=UPI002AFDFCAC|nr:alpha/beta hydrolase [Paenibacillus sp. SGZ-1014]
MVVVEPFGYGLSDVTDRLRTVDNITNEIHSALQQLTIDHYVLIGHSIAGIYGLDYVNKYAQEVIAFAGIEQHERQLEHAVHGKIVPLAGTHYLHYTQSTVIADELRSFLGSIR